jgi:hypothetical protein
VNAPGPIFVISRQCRKALVSWGNTVFRGLAIPVNSRRFSKSRGPHADPSRFESGLSGPNYLAPVGSGLI